MNKTVGLDVLNLLSVAAELLREPPGAGGRAHRAAVLREHPPQRRLAEARLRRHPPVSTPAQGSSRLSRRPAPPRRCFLSQLPPLSSQHHSCLTNYVLQSGAGFISPNELYETQGRGFQVLETDSFHKNPL